MGPLLPASLVNARLTASVTVNAASIGSPGPAQPPCKIRDRLGIRLCREAAGCSEGLRESPPGVSGHG